MAREAWADEPRAASSMPVVIVVVVISVAAGAHHVLMAQLPSPAQRFLLQPGNAVAVEIRLPGGQFLFGKQVTCTNLGEAQHAVTNGANDRDFLPCGPSHSTFGR